MTKWVKRGLTIDLKPNYPVYLLPLTDINQVTRLASINNNFAVVC